MIGRPHPELVEGEAGIYALTDLAFDGPEQSQIRAALRREALIALSLVAEDEGPLGAGLTISKRQRAWRRATASGRIAARDRR